MARVATRTGGRDATTGVIPGRYALSVGKPDRDPPPGWKWTLLTDVARLETGHTPSRKHPEYWNGDVPWLGIRDATAAHGFTIHDTVEHTNELGIANSSARILPPNTVCLSRTASIGYVVVMGRPMATSQDFVNWVCSDEIDFRFLKYVLLAERESLPMFASGSVHQTIYMPEVKAFHVCLPPIEEQRRIADMLSTLDDKIELNRRTNRTLESFARAIFKSWFVDFGPVLRKMRGKASGSRGLPSSIDALYPSVMARSERMSIPEGWCVKPLDQIAQFLNGLALQKYPPTGRDDLRVVKGAELTRGITSGSGEASRHVPPAYVVHDGDVLFSWSGTLNCVVWSGGEAALNQHVFKVVPVGVPSWFSYYWVLEHLAEFRSIAADKATTMGHIRRTHLSQAAVVVPTPDVLQAADSYLAPLVSRRLVCAIEARRLAALRDELIPRLLCRQLGPAPEQGRLETDRCR